MGPSSEKLEQRLRKRGESSTGQGGAGTGRLGRYTAQMFNAQLGLLGLEEPRFDPQFRALERVHLDRTAWVDYAPGWLAGHETLFDHLSRTTTWRSGEEFMYDRLVTTPRVFGMIPEDGPGHPILEAMRIALSNRYGEQFTRVSLALYRDGRDSVAFHGDRVARTLPHALVATVSLGAPRRFLMRPRPASSAAHGGEPHGRVKPAPNGTQANELGPAHRREAAEGRGQARDGAARTWAPDGSVHPIHRSRAWNLGWGDLIVMGGSCQRTWQHGVPKAARANPRIAVMFRPQWDSR
jgi:alkylated DNA repair dioxygenase AlkB